MCSLVKWTLTHCDCKLIILYYYHTCISITVSECSVQAKNAFLLYGSTRVTCTNTLLNDSDDWHFVSQACFHCQYYCVTLCVQLVMCHIAQNFDGGKFWCFWCFQARPSKFNPSNCLKTVQHLQVYGERQ